MPISVTSPSTGPALGGTVPGPHYAHSLHMSTQGNSFQGKQKGCRAILCSAGRQHHSEQELSGYSSAWTRPSSPQPYCLDSCDSHSPSTKLLPRLALLLLPKVYVTPHSTTAGTTRLLSSIQQRLQPQGCSAPHHQQHP